MCPITDVEFFHERGLKRTRLGTYLVLVQCGWGARGRGRDERGHEDAAPISIFQGRWLKLQGLGTAQNGFDHRQKGCGYLRPLSVSFRGSTQNREQNSLAPWRADSHKPLVGPFWCTRLHIRPGFMLPAHPSAPNIIIFISSTYCMPGRALGAFHDFTHEGYN